MEQLVSQIVKQLKRVEVTRISMPKGDEMIRAGGGFNKGRGFVRLDLWDRGVRFTRRK